MNTDKVIASARKNIGGLMESSARFCLAQAMEQVEAGNYDNARSWAVKSLAYSVGVFHPDYRKAAE